MHTPQGVLEFWFGDRASDTAATAKDKSRLWWSKSEDADREVRDRFLHLVEKAAMGHLSGWTATPGGRLALILVTDQFPRNIFRGSKHAFDFDKLALGWCLDGLAQQVDPRLLPSERWFFYLPLQHSESLEHQDQSVRLFRKLLADAGDEERAVFEGCLDYAIRHRDVISEFGRFPHRNTLLGRVSTPKELAFLAKPGSSF